jgi:hypothetical protein
MVLIFVMSRLLRWVPVNADGIHLAKYAVAISSLNSYRGAHLEDVWAIANRVYWDSGNPREPIAVWNRTAAAPIKSAHHSEILARTFSCGGNGDSRI